MTKEENSRGGQRQSQKVYYCHKCGGIGRSNSMVSSHLKHDCNGKQGRKLQKSTKELSDRLEEAIHNTKVWKTEQINKEVAEYLKANQASVRAQIEELHAAVRTGSHDVLEHYYQNIF